MANKKYTELPQANAITGAEILAIVQDGGSVQGDIDLIKAYFDTLYVPVSTIITAPVAWTPTFTGFGVVSGVTAYSWRVGALLFFEIRFTSGTTTNVEARISLGFNGTDGNVTTASNYPTLQIVGKGATHNLSGSTGGGSAVVLAEASKTYITFGVAITNLVVDTDKANGDRFISSQPQMFCGCVRIQGW